MVFKAVARDALALHWVRSRAYAFPPFTLLLLLVLRIVVGGRSVFRTDRSSLAREVLIPSFAGPSRRRTVATPSAPEPGGSAVLRALPRTGGSSAAICTTIVRDRAEGAGSPARVASFRLSFVTSPRDRSTTRNSTSSRLGMRGRESTSSLPRSLR